MHRHDAPLDFLEERDRIKEMRLAELRKDIQKGVESGESVDGELVFERLREKSRARKRKGA